LYLRSPFIGRGRFGRKQASERILAEKIVSKLQVPVSRSSTLEHCAGSDHGDDQARRAESAGSNGRPRHAHVETRDLRHQKSRPARCSKTEDRLYSSVHGIPYGAWSTNADKRAKLRPPQ
jgi:hypothetical protein